MSERGVPSNLRKHQYSLIRSHLSYVTNSMERSSLPAGAMNPNVRDLRGVSLDPQTRCEHYHGPTDIIAIKMKCCGTYYACKDCHEELAGHRITVWPESEWDQQAVLCGACGEMLTIFQYMHGDSHCPACRAQFNPVSQPPSFLFPGASGC